MALHTEVNDGQARCQRRQWARIAPHLPRRKASPRGGRPPVNDRKCFDGILWILWTGAPWKALPREYGSATTCWRRLRQWEEDGTLLELWRAFLGLVERCREGALGRVLHRRELRPRERGGAGVGKTKRGKGTKWMVLVDGAGTPLGLHLDSASPSERKILEATLNTVAVRWVHRAGRPRRYPDRLIADRGYDSNDLRASLAERGIEPIIPAQINHPNATHQDGRKRRYRHRWIIERTFAWLGWSRRLLVRPERLLVVYVAFFHLACLMFTIRQVLK